MLSLNTLIVVVGWCYTTVRTRRLLRNRGNRELLLRELRVLYWQMVLTIVGAGALLVLYLLLT